MSAMSFLSSFMDGKQGNAFQQMFQPHQQAAQQGQPNTLNTPIGTGMNPYALTEAPEMPGYAPPPAPGQPGYQPTPGLAQRLIQMMAAAGG